MGTYPRHVFYFSRKFYLRSFDLSPKNQIFDPSCFDPIQMFGMSTRGLTDFRSRSFDLFPPTLINQDQQFPPEPFNMLDWTPVFVKTIVKTSRKHTWLYLCALSVQQCICRACHKNVSPHCGVLRLGGFALIRIILNSIFQGCFAY